ncbi:hypothetical protein D9758_007252 [Tetrapyrgos nigripes]|uniref:Uncharacterized protein n=1 Tax=Tetrapyrgos nigripes TaxID=182062 RepID=A0A8H5D0Y9_9AGAR|nr:hypothetical protein D9758_007252 [Tetrapyrgos nigripes]
MSNVPELPPELISAILDIFWSSDDLLPKDRITFMTSSLLVSSTWATQFIHITTKDVYIPTPSYVPQLLRVLRGDSSSYNGCGFALHNALTRSITFRYDGDPEKMMLTRQHPHPMSLAVLCVFHVLFIPTSFTERLPNLRRISIELNNCTIDDFFSRNKFYAFPRQVTHFDLRFSYSPFVSSADLFEMMGSEKPIGLVPGSMPNIRHLSLHGATEVVLNEFIWACPNLEAVVTDVVGYDGPHYEEEQVGADDVEDDEGGEEEAEAEDDAEHEEGESQSTGQARLAGQPTRVDEKEDVEEVDSGYASAEEDETSHCHEEPSTSSTLKVYLRHCAPHLPDIRGL